MSQRAVRLDQVAYILKHGKVYNRAGATWYTLRRKDVPPADRSNDRVQRAVGVIVCAGADGILTVYHHQRPSIHIRRKDKRDLRPRR